MRTLEQVEQDQRRLADELKLIRDQQAKDAEGPWAPYESINGGLSYTSAKDGIRLEESYQKRGTRFPTKSALDQATPFFNFYHRYFQLAMECKAMFPDATCTSHYDVRHSHINGVQQWNIQATPFHTISTFITSHEAAKEMARIMNRDQWVLPEL